mmetsp:Transcript_116363/g.307519  ORF Transcript_116363/g.307519 Transcript_116363/m.307519 type:complete len:209 (+) Transcript_116363:143-769(+)
MPAEAQLQRLTKGQWWQPWTNPSPTCLTCRTSTSPPSRSRTPPRRWPQPRRAQTRGSPAGQRRPRPSSIPGSTRLRPFCTTAFPLRAQAAPRARVRGVEIRARVAMIRPSETTCPAPRRPCRCRRRLPNAVPRASAIDPTTCCAARRRATIGLARLEARSRCDVRVRIPLSPFALARSTETQRSRQLVCAAHVGHAHRVVKGERGEAS